MMRKSIAWIVVLVLTAGGCATTGPAVKPVKEADVFLKEVCRQNDVRIDWDSVSQIVYLNKDGNKANILVGSPVAMINGHRVQLSKPVARRDGRIVVPPDFVDKVLAQLVEIEERRPAGSKIIVLDPGHGGHDPGAIGRSGLQEKDVVLDISMRLKKVLEHYGLTVVTTRDRDVFVELNDRAAMAAEVKADLFISIHANSNRSGGAEGFEVYYLRDVDEWERYHEYLTPEIRANIHRFNIRKNDRQLDEIVFDLLYDYKQAESKKLAAVISENMASDVHAVNRGVKEANFRVLKNTLIPAVLIEVGFLSNRREEQLLSSDEHRQRIAESVAGNILDYIRSQ